MVNITCQHNSPVDKVLGVSVKGYLDYRSGGGRPTLTAGSSIPQDRILGQMKRVSKEPEHQHSPPSASQMQMQCDSCFKSPRLSPSLHGGGLHPGT